MEERNKVSITFTLGQKIIFLVLFVIFTESVVWAIMHTHHSTFDIHDLFDVHITFIKDAHKGISSTIQKGIARYKWLTWLVSVLGVAFVWKLFSVRLVTKTLDIFVSWLLSFFWKFETISLSWYLMLPWTKFPGLQLRSKHEIVDSIYDQFLFENLKLNRRLRIQSNKPSALGFEGQYDKRIEEDIDSYIVSMYELGLKFVYFQNRLKELQEFWNDYLSGTFDRRMLLVIQCSFWNWINLELRPEKKHYLEDTQIKNCLKYLYGYFEFGFLKPTNNIQNAKVEKFLQVVAKTFALENTSSMNEIFQKDHGNRNNLMDELEDTLQKIYKT